MVQETATTGTQACTNCGFKNRHGVIFCERCGNPVGLNLGNMRTTLAIPDELKDRLQSLTDRITDESEHSTLHITKPTTDRQRGTSVFASGMLLRLDIGRVPEPVFQKIVEGETIILGRDAPDTDFLPTVNLMPFGGFKLGISRRHAALHLAGKCLTVTDQDSSNGTYLNGAKLSPYEPHQLRDGDRLQLANLVMRVYFQQESQD
jgi:hypothetical protein